MAASYLHGIETLETDSGGSSATIVRSAVIGLVGTAPEWLESTSLTVPQPNTPTQVNGSRDASVFGPRVKGYTIPTALDIMSKEGQGQAIVVNVFNPLVHNTAVSGQVVTMPASAPQVVSLGHMGIIGPGLPGTPDATATAVSVASAGGGSPATSYNGGDTITLAGGSAATPAVLTVGTVTLTSVVVNAPGGASAHSYAPGDKITASGGTATTPAQLSVVTTQVSSATIAAGGSGGTNGTQTVTGTTGTGTKFRASVTVAGGAITAVNSITAAGGYSVNPAVLTDEPVTGAGLTGAALSLVMGVASVAIAAGGAYTVKAASLTQASSTGSGTGATFTSAAWGVLSASITTAGSYTTTPSSPVAQASTTGTGTGATFAVTWGGPPSTVVIKNALGTTTYVENTDYTVDYVNGALSAVSGGAIVTGQQLLSSFSYCDPSKVTNSDIVGAISGSTYTGMQAFLLSFNLFGYWPKLLEAPGYSKELTVASAMTTLANSIRAMAYKDSAPGTTVAQAIANRSVSGAVFNTSSNRDVLCFPTQTYSVDGVVDPTAVTINSLGSPVQGKLSDTASGHAYSQFVAARQAAVDISKGYWYSASNTDIISPIAGPDVTMYMSAFDGTADNQNLNAAGILTVFNMFGTGLRVWGNRSAEYPSSTVPDNFIPIRRVLDVLEESIQLTALQYTDQPISNGLINNILTTGRGLIRSLVGRGALLSGSTLTYSSDDNPATQLAAGQIVFEIDCMPPPPAERITFKTTVDINLLSSIGPTTTSSSTSTTSG